MAHRAFAVEQVVFQRLTDEADPVFIFHVQDVKPPAGFDRVGVAGEIQLVLALDGHVFLDDAVLRDVQVGGHSGRRPGDALHSLQVLEILIGQAHFQGRALGLHHQGIGPQIVELAVDLGDDALHGGDQGDDGRHADDDAQDGEEGPHFVMHDILPGHFQAFPKHPHRLLPRPRRRFHPPAGDRPPTACRPGYGRSAGRWRRCSRRG